MSHPARPWRLSPVLAAALSAALTCAALAAEPAPPAAGAAPPATAASSALAQLPTLTLHDLLSSTSDHLAAVRRIDLRREETVAELDHLRASRAFQVEVEGNYNEEQLDRIEVNGPRVKEGDQEDIRRRVTFAVTRPLLGQSVEDRLLTANQELRLVELRESAAVARRDAYLEMIGAYVDLGAEQRHRELKQQAGALAAERVRILEERAARGESLTRDVLAAKADLAARQVETAAGARREAELMADLAMMVDGEAPGPFRAAELDWRKMLPVAGAPPPAPKPVEPVLNRGPRSSVWYNLPEVDIRFFYSIVSRDRTFVDEDDSEEGYIPGIEVTLEFPLELWRSGKSFAKQVEARYERQRLALLSIERETAGRASAATLAHAEAAARLNAAEAELALREEERRIARLKTTDVDAGARGELQVIDSELAVIDAQIDLVREQGVLAQRYFERAMAEGSDPIELAAATSCSPCRERMARAEPPTRSRPDL